MTDDKQSSEDTFTIGEMRRAYIKYMNGEKLTEKERKLAEAKARAVRACCGIDLQASP